MHMYWHRIPPNNRTPIITPQVQREPVQLCYPFICYGLINICYQNIGKNLTSMHQDDNP